MKKLIALLVLSLFVVLQSCKKDDPTPDYSDKFAGVWKGVRLTQNGQTLNLKGATNISVTLTITRIEVNKVKISLVTFANGQTTTTSPDDILPVKNLDANNYELTLPPSPDGSGYLTLNVNTGELKFGGYSGGSAVEFVFNR